MYLNPCRADMVLLLRMALRYGEHDKKRSSCTENWGRCQINSVSAQCRRYDMISPDTESNRNVEEEEEEEEEDKEADEEDHEIDICNVVRQKTLPVMIQIA